MPWTRLGAWRAREGWRTEKNCKRISPTPRMIVVTIYHCSLQDRCPKMIPPLNVADPGYIYMADRSPQPNGAYPPFNTTDPFPAQWHHPSSDRSDPSSVQLHRLTPHRDSPLEALIFSHKRAKRKFSL